MVDFTRDANAIKETDIVFDCPNCSKSLAIDYRGAGLSIPCTDCGHYVNVPIPEGMELTDLDSSDEDQEIRILNLRKSLAEAESRISDLESKLEQTAAAAREGTAEGTAEVTVEDADPARLAVIGEQVEALQRLLQEASAALEKLAEAVSYEEEPPPEE